jgi:hypothetical protein
LTHEDILRRDQILKIFVQRLKYQNEEAEEERTMPFTVDCASSLTSFYRTALDVKAAFFMMLNDTTTRRKRRTRSR